MPTVIKNASVKVMLSYDYSHFEASMSLENEDGLTSQEIDEARKKCQRLADKAVGQYKTAKSMASKRSNAEYDKKYFLNQVADIQKKSEGDRTVNEMAILKQYQDENWQAQFDYNYDYDDDDQYGN